MKTKFKPPQDYKGSVSLLSELSMSFLLSTNPTLVIPDYSASQ